MAEKMQSRIVKVVVKFQEKDEVFYTRFNTQYKANLQKTISDRYPSLQGLINRCFVVDKAGAPFTLITPDDLEVFLDGQDYFNNEIIVEINGVNRTTETPVTPEKRAKLEATAAVDTNLPVHTNVVCDCCDQVVVGFRYKCTQCYNFDLCSGCEQKMRHREHIMIRIPEPADRLSVFKDRHCRTPKWFSAESTNPNGEPCKSSKRHHKKHHSRRSHGNIEEVMKFLNVECPARNLMEASAGESGHSSDNNEPEKPKAEPKIMTDFYKLLQTVETVAGNVTKLFDPMNISGSATEQPPAGPSTAEKEAQPEPKKVVITMEKEKTPVTEVKDSFAEMSVKSPTPLDQFIPTTEEGNSTHVPMEVDNNKKASKQSSLDGDAEWTVLENEEEESSQSSEASKAKADPPSAPVADKPTNDQNVGYEELARNLQKEIENQLKSTTSTNTATQTVRDVPVPIVYHPIPHIHQGVAQMVDMGFSNEGNFLTNLMVSCNGDINRCLNILSRRS